MGSNKYMICPKLPMSNCTLIDMNPTALFKFLSQRARMNTLQEAISFDCSILNHSTGVITRMNFDRRLVIKIILVMKKYNPPNLRSLFIDCCHEGEYIVVKALLRVVIPISNIPMRTAIVNGKTRVLRVLLADGRFNPSVDEVLLACKYGRKNQSLLCWLMEGSILLVVTISS
jgi:hypothetical protein